MVVLFHTAALRGGGLFVNVTCVGDTAEAASLQGAASFFIVVMLWLGAYAPSALVREQAELTHSAVTTHVSHDSAISHDLSPAPTLGTHALLRLMSGLSAST